MINNDPATLLLLCSPMPGRFHYAFNLRQITRMCQCFRRIHEEDRQNEVYIASFWKHEMERLIGDQLSRTSDVSWFEDNLNKVNRDVFGAVLEGKQSHEYFTTFPGVTLMYDYSQPRFSPKIHSCYRAAILTD